MSAAEKAAEVTAIVEITGGVGAAARKAAATKVNRFWESEVIAPNATSATEDKVTDKRACADSLRGCTNDGSAGTLTSAGSSSCNQ